MCQSKTFIEIDGEWYSVENNIQTKIEDDDLECNCHETGELDDETGEKLTNCMLCGEGVIEEVDNQE
tara:strand:+ start:316 stop:516 length:201 start_codon:yes stop_codon:yes gene_type:complete